MWQEPPSHQVEGVGSAVSFPARFRAAPPHRPKVFHYFHHSGWPLLTPSYAAIGGTTPLPPCVHIRVRDLCLLPFRDKRQSGRKRSFSYHVPGRYHSNIITASGLE